MDVDSERALRSTRDTGDALRKVARVDGRGIKVCKKRRLGKRSVMMCNVVASREITGERGVQHEVDCAYTAVIERWDAKACQGTRNLLDHEVHPAHVRIVRIETTLLCQRGCRR